MNRYIFLVFLFLPTLCLGQKFIPFEFQRAAESQYASEVFFLAGGNDSSEESIMQFYLAAYNRQRAENPINYFPAPDENRNTARAQLMEKFPSSPALALLDYLESGGTELACENLIKSGDHVYNRSYRFLAAYLLDNEKVMDEILTQISNSEFLTPVQRGFGKNAVNSIGKKQEVVTQGLVDLILISLARKDSGRKMKIHNVVASKTMAYSGRPIEVILSTPGKEFWLSPGLDVVYFKSAGKKLDQQGIGYCISDNPNPKQSVTLSTTVCESFAGLGESPKNGSDNLILHNYGFFVQYLDALKNEGVDFGESIVRLKTYLNSGKK